MPNQGVPVIFKNKIAYGYAEKSVQAYDVSVSDYNALTEQQQLDGSIRFIQGVDAIPNGSNVWAKLGTTPLAEGLPRDCSQAVNQLKSNLTWKEASTFNQAYTNAINEVLVIISNNNPALGTTFTFPKSFLSSLTNNKYFTNGYHYNASTYALMQIFINISDMSGTCSAYSNGVAVQGAEAKFYYR